MKPRIVISEIFGLKSLNRFEDLGGYKLDIIVDVAENFECGITIENFNDIKEGDMIEAFEMQEIKD